MSIILGIILSTLTAWLTQFWAWIVGAAVAILGLLFSPALRKWTIAAIALMAIVGGTYFYAYNKGFDAPHKAMPVACSEFSKHLVKGAATDKAIRIFKQHGLCV